MQAGLCLCCLHASKVRFSRDNEISPHDDLLLPKLFLKKILKVIFTWVALSKSGLILGLLRLSVRNTFGGAYRSKLYNKGYQLKAKS